MLRYALQAFVRSAYRHYVSLPQRLRPRPALVLIAGFEYVQQAYRKTNFLRKHPRSIRHDDDCEGVCVMVQMPMRTGRHLVANVSISKARLFLSE